ncbi:hypothetical protein [Methanosarcina sp. MTP4]|uniref:hypothetical protein n=1 Tax=Methanosarcina sp. MTP4 TaxID=1434100 RepID=UPI00064F194B|nr:hypothetical protein [Methanosarcina sp. MTP4]
MINYKNGDLSDLEGSGNGKIGREHEKENIRLQDMRFGCRYQEKKTAEKGKVCLEAIEESYGPL